MKSLGKFKSISVHVTIYLLFVHCVDAWIRELFQEIVMALILILTWINLDLRIATNLRKNNNFIDSPFSAKI